MAGKSATPEERGVTLRRIEWSQQRAGDWQRAIETKDAALARSLYEEFGELLKQEIAEQGGAPVLSVPEVNARIRRRVRALKGRTALDLGCGPTPVAAMSLADADFMAVGVDIAHSILQIARSTSNGSVRTAVADGELLPFADASFDVITCDDTLEHALDQRAMAAEMVRVLRPGGRLLLVSPNAGAFHVLLARTKDLLRGRRHPRRHYHVTESHTFERRYRELRRLLGPGLVRVRSEWIGYPDAGRWRWVNRALALPAMWRFGSIHFLEFERRASRSARPQTAAAHYAGLDTWQSQTSPSFVRDALGAWLAETSLQGPGLDLGTGVGGNLAFLRDRYRVVGSEISASAASAAAALGPVAVADGARLPFADSSFGFVVCTEVLEHVGDPSVVFAEIARVLRPGGLAYVTTPNYANLAGLHKKLADRRSGRADWNPWGAHHGGFEAFMTGRKLVALARPHLEVVRVRGLDFGQALTGRFRPLDRAAWSRPGLAVLRRALPALDRRSTGALAWHGMHVELVLRRHGGAR